MLLFVRVHILCFDMDIPGVKTLFLCVHYISHIKDGSTKIHLSETHAYRYISKVTDIAK